MQPRGIHKKALCPNVRHKLPNYLSIIRTKCTNSYAPVDFLRICFVLMLINHEGARNCRKPLGRRSEGKCQIWWLVATNLGKEIHYCIDSRKCHEF